MAMREIAKLILLVASFASVRLVVSAEWTFANESQVARLSFDVERTSRISIPCVANQPSTIFWYKLFRSGVERFYSADANIEQLQSNATNYMVRRSDQLYFDDSHLSRVIAQSNGTLVIENARLFVCGTWHCFRLCNQSDSSQCSYPVYDSKSGRNLWLAHVSEVDISVQVIGFQGTYVYSLIYAVCSAGVTFVCILVYSIVMLARKQLKKAKRRDRNQTAENTDKTDASPSPSANQNQSQNNPTSLPSTSHDDVSASGDVRVGCDAFNLLDLLLLADVHHDAHKLREKLVLLRERFHSRLGNFKFPHSPNCWSSNETRRTDSPDTLPKNPSPLLSAASDQDTTGTPVNVDRDVESTQMLTVAGSNFARSNGESLVENENENGEEKIEMGNQNEEDMLAEAAQRGAWNLHRAWKSLMHRHGASIKIKRKKSGEYHFHPIEFLKRFESYKAKTSSSKKKHRSDSDAAAPRDPNEPSTSRD